MEAFKMAGFNHVTEAGIIEFYQMLDIIGTSGQMYDMTNQQAIDCLTRTTNFKQDFSVSDEEFMSFHDELSDARFMVEFCFATLQDSITCNGRTLSNLSSILEMETIYCEPLLTEFSSLNALAKYSMENTPKGEINVRVSLSKPIDEIGDGHENQAFTWRITGAADFHVLSDMLDTAYQKYAEITYTIV